MKGGVEGGSGAALWLGSSLSGFPGKPSGHGRHAVHEPSPHHPPFPPREGSARSDGDRSVGRSVGYDLSRLGRFRRRRLRNLSASVNMKQAGGVFYAVMFEKSRRCLDNPSRIVQTLSALLDRPLRAVKAERESVSDEVTNQLSLQQPLTREQLLELITKLSEGEGTEQEEIEWLMLIEANVIHPAVSDLIFYRDPSLSPEEVLEEALSYKPILL